MRCFDRLNMTMGWYDTPQQVQGVSGWVFFLCNLIVVFCFVSEPFFCGKCVMDSFCGGMS